MTKENIKEWLKNKLAEHLGIEKNDIDLKESIFAYGLDSSSALIISGEIEALLDINIDHSFFWEYENINEIVASLEHEVNKKTREKLVEIY